MADSKSAMWDWIERGGMNYTATMTQADGNVIPTRTISNWNLSDDFLTISANGIEEHYPIASVSIASFDKYETFPDEIPISSAERTQKIEVELFDGKRYDADGYAIHRWWTIGTWLGIEVFTLNADGVCRFVVIPISAIRLDRKSVV